MGNNCGGMRHPDPKNPDINYCGNYKTNPNGRGYTRELIPTDTVGSNFTIPDYCIPHGPSTLITPADAELIATVGSVIVGTATGGIGLGGLVAVAGTITAAAETADQAIVDNLTYKYKDQLNNYCQSVGDSVVTEDGTKYMWSSLATSLDECKQDIFSNSEDCTKRFFYDPGQCYASHDGYTYFTNPGICDGVITRNGVNGACSRNSDVFPGNPFVCCMSDYAVNNDGEENPPSCYEDPESKQRTCDPLHRDLAAPTCQDVVRPYCLGEKSVPGANSFLELWTPESEINLSSFMEIDSTEISNNWRKNVVSNYPVAGNKYSNNPTTISERQFQSKNDLNVKAPCLNAIARSIYKDSSIKNWDDLAQITLRRSDMDPEGLAWAQQLVYDFYKKYTKEYGSFIGTINSDGIIKSDQFKEVIGSICGKFPFLCSEFLAEACSSVTANEFVYLEPDARSWCGCYMKPSEYEKYTNLDIPLECTPTCNSSKVIPLVDGNFVPKVCKDTVCIIDQLNLDITNSIYPGGFNFNQLCSSCGPVDQVESGVEGSIYDQITSNNAFILVNSSGPDLTINNNIIKINGIDITFKNIDGYYTSSDFSLYDLDGNLLLDNGVLVLDLNLSIIQLAGEDNINALETEVPTEVIIGTEKGDKFSIPSNPTKVSIIKGTVSLGSDISAYTSVGNDTDIIRSNTCTCILPDAPMDVENSKIASFNLNQVCGSSKCYNANKEPIPCSSGSIEYSAINTVEDSLTNFKVTTIQNKNNFTLLIVSSIFLFFSLIFIRVFKDNLNSGTKYFTWTMILLIIAFVVLSAIKIVEEDKDLSKYF